jgi:hypothetical protein
MRKVLITIIFLSVGAALGYALYPLTQSKFVDDPLPETTERAPVEKPELTTEVSLPNSISMAHLSDMQKTDMMRQLIEANKAEPEEMSDILPNDMFEGIEEPIRTPITATPLHPATGFVRFIESTEGEVIRFEDYETINGPNLHVYLANDLDATDFVDLGKIRGTMGNINYTVPEEVDVSKYKYVLVWCVPFGVLFHSAEILL